MPKSQNGWPASPGLDLRPLIVDAVSFIPGIVDNDDVATVLGYVVREFHERVEPLRNPGCWGFSYRPNVNHPDQLSNHSSGTAVDVNAPKHPNGVPTRETFTVAQVVEIHRILIEARGAVRWGGDYVNTPDAMHFEINVDPATLAAVATHLEEDMPYTEAELTKLVRDAVKAELAELDDVKVDLDNGGAKQKLGAVLGKILNRTGDN